MLVGKIHLGLAPCLPGTSSIMILLSVMMVNISVHTQFGSITAKLYVNDELWDQMQEDYDLDLEKQVNCQLNSQPIAQVWLHYNHN